MNLLNLVCFNRIHAFTNFRALRSCIAQITAVYLHYDVHAAILNRVRQSDNWKSGMVGIAVETA